MRAVRVLFVVTLASIPSWAVTDAQAQNAIKLFNATPVTESAPCAGPFGCDVVLDRMVFDEAALVLSCKGRPRAILSSTADGSGGLETLDARLRRIGIGLARCAAQGQAGCRQSAPL